MLTMFVGGHLAQAQISESRTVTPFTKIDATDGVEIVLNPNGPPSVAVFSENTDELINVITEIKGTTLKIKKLKNNGIPATVYVSAPGIISISVSSKSKVTVNGQLQSETLSISVTSGAQFTGNLKSQKVSVRAKYGAMFNGRIESDVVTGNFRNGAKIILSGKAQNTFIRTDSGAICSARNFISNDMTVYAGDLSSVNFSADSKVRIAMSDTAKVSYYGSPESVEIPSQAMIISNRTTDKLLTGN